jgi:hypothetical protein
MPNLKENLEKAARVHRARLAAYAVPAKIELPLDAGAGVR